MVRKARVSVAPQFGVILRQASFFALVEYHRVQLGSRFPYGSKTRLREQPLWGCRWSVSLRKKLAFLV